MDYGFTLDAAEISEKIHEALARPGWQLSTYLDSFAHPDYRTGMWIEHDPVDRAVVVFVGPRREAGVVEQAARTALAATGGGNGGD